VRASDIQPEALEPWAEFRFDTASGPGGQNVNKVATRATLLFALDACDLLTPAQRARIAARLAGRITRDGKIRIVSQRGRTQGENRTAALERLAELLRDAVHVPTPRRPTRPSRGSVKRRLEDKRRRSDTKRQRQFRGRPE